MSLIEDRLGQELRELAERLAPGDLRPLRPPAGGPVRSRLRWLAPVAAMTAIALIAGGLALARQTLGSLPARHPAHPSHPVRLPGLVLPPLPDPPYVAVEGEPYTERTDLVKLISVRTGRVIRTLTAAEGAGISVALARDGRSLFDVPLAGSRYKIYQVPLSGGKRRPIGSGITIAAGSDSRFVAYAMGTERNPYVLAVTNVTGGGTQQLDLTSLIGGNATIADITWLGDGDQLVVLPLPAVWGLFNDVPTDNGPENACGQQRSPNGLCVVVVTVTGRGLIGRRVFLPGWRLPGGIGRLVLSGDLTVAQSFLIAGPGAPAGRIAEVSLGGGGASVRRVASLPRLAQPMTIAPDGDRVVYEPRGASTEFSGSIELRVASMSHGRLIRDHLLLAFNDQFEWSEDVSW